MILKEVLIDTAVILPWDTTDEIKAEGCFGLKDVLCAANGLTELTPQFLAEEGEYIVVGHIGDDLTPDEEKWFSNAKTARLINEDSLSWYVKDLFRQGYVGEGFYIVLLNSNTP